jgi:hypothetical protein
MNQVYEEGDINLNSLLPDLGLFLAIFLLALVMFQNKGYSQLLNGGLRREQT